MRRNRSKNTRPELLLRKALWAHDLKGYRLHLKKLQGSPDIVFSTKKIAIFVHGCFWHRCPKCDLNLPKSNTKFWAEKFKKNKERDARNIRILSQNDWTVLTIWECEIKNDLYAQVQRISKAIKDLKSYEINNSPLTIAAEDLLNYRYEHKL